MQKSSSKISWLKRCENKRTDRQTDRLTRTITLPFSLTRTVGRYSLSIKFAVSYSWVTA